jgi:bacterioferritin-associated ferredoxin
MYICICNAVTDRDIRDAMVAGAETFADLREELRVGSGCGNCGPAAEECLEASKQQAFTYAVSAELQGALRG